MNSRAANQLWVGDLVKYVHCTAQASHKVFVDRPRRVFLFMGLRNCPSAWAGRRHVTGRAFAYDCSGSPIFIGPFDSPEVL